MPIHALFATHEREILLSFSECIRECHRLKPAMWGLTDVTAAHLRLNFGGLAVAAVYFGQLWLTVPSGKNPDLDRNEHWTWTPQWTSKAVPGRSGFFLPLTRSRRAWTAVRRHHFAFLALTADKYNVLRPASRAAHSEPSIAAIEASTGARLPRPTML